MKYFLIAVIVACSLCSYEPFRTTTPSQSEIFLQSCYCNWLSLPIQAFEDHNTLPKWNIFRSCYCNWLSLSICIGLLGPRTPSQSEIFFKNPYCSLFSLLSACLSLSWPQHPPKVKYSLLLETPSQSEIFSVTVNTLPKWNIFSKAVIVACLFECIGLSGPQHPPKVKYFLKALIVTCLYECIGLPGPQHPPKVKYWDRTVIVIVFQDHYTLPKERKVHKYKGLV